MKYVDVLVGFQEVPDEISLCINISNCIHNCKGCHSSYLKEDVGNPLTKGALQKLIDDNKGITCVCLMGGDRYLKEIEELTKVIHDNQLKVCWYIGADSFPVNVDKNLFDYYKIGHYDERFGPLNSPTTNQQFFAKGKCLDNLKGEAFYDITKVFFK